MGIRVGARLVRQARLAAALCGTALAAGIVTVPAMAQSVRTLDGADIPQLSRRHGSGGHIAERLAHEHAVSDPATTGELGLEVCAADETVPHTARQPVEGAVLGPQRSAVDDRGRVDGHRP